MQSRRFEAKLGDYSNFVAMTSMMMTLRPLRARPNGPDNGLASVRGKASRLALLTICWMTRNFLAKETR